MEDKKMNKKRKWLGILLLVVCVLAFAGCSQKSENQEEPPEEVLHPQDEGSTENAQETSEQEVLTKMAAC